MTTKQAIAEAAAEADVKAVRDGGRESQLFGALTPREAETLRLVAEGMTDARAAREMSISPRTVNAHMRSIYQKLGTSSRSDDARLAREHGLV